MTEFSRRLGVGVALVCFLVFWVRLLAGLAEENSLLEMAANLAATCAAVVLAASFLEVEGKMVLPASLLFTLLVGGVAWWRGWPPDLLACALAIGGATLLFAVGEATAWLRSHAFGAHIG